MSSRFASGLRADDRPKPGAVEQRGGSVSQDVKLPPLQLTNAQRELIRQAVLTQHKEIEFQLKSTKPAKDFEPKVGAVLPSRLNPDGFPSSILQKLPQLRNFAYLTMKEHVLIIDATTRKIVDVFSETQPLT